MKTEAKGAATVFRHGNAARGGTLTVFRDLQDVADQGTVAVKRLGPCEVDGSLLCGAQNRDWILWSVGKLPVGTDGCEERDRGREKNIRRSSCKYGRGKEREQT